VCEREKKSRKEREWVCVGEGGGERECVCVSMYASESMYVRSSVSVRERGRKKERERVCVCKGGGGRERVCVCQYVYAKSMRDHP